jgi:hypothetical protein
MREDTKTSELVRIVESGAKLTREQMAKKIHCSPSSVSAILGSLGKRHGIIIRPIGTMKNPYTGVFKKGVLTLMDNEEVYYELAEKNNKNINGILGSHFNIVEKAYTDFPKLRDEIENAVGDLQIRLIEEKKRLKKNNLLIEGKK